MSYSVYVRRLAELDALEAQAWYELQQSGLGESFNSQFGRALGWLEHNPLTCQKIYGPVRRVLLRRFPYLRWFVVEGETVIVLACTHGKRSHSFIRSRLR
ncbi:MAG: type II toxin-antitoxin system RelE/ParE family toxin [Panacagrimonas sp.]